MAANQTNNEQRGLFDGLSLVQVVAAALAAVTSVLLSSQIGIAGSIIGVAVASVVSTVASQVYRNTLLRSADKLREMRDASVEANASAAPSTVAANQAADIAGKPTQDDTSAGQDTSATQNTAALEREGFRVAPRDLRERAAQRRKDTLKRRLIIATVAFSLVAVLVYAGIVMLVTGGEGIGEKRSIISEPTATKTVAPATPTVDPTPSTPVVSTTSSAETEHVATTAATTEASTEAASTEAASTDAASTEAASTEATTEDTNTE